ncbi:hypothetical protein CSUI_005068, partial [Cystoisospora suis]
SSPTHDVAPSSSWTKNSLYFCWSSWRSRWSMIPPMRNSSSLYGCCTLSGRRVPEPSSGRRRWFGHSTTGFKRGTWK